MSLALAFAAALALASAPARDPQGVPTTAAPPSAPGQEPQGAPPADVRARVRALLGAIHGPVSPETFRALGPGAEEALLEFARDGEGLPSRRIRALEALAGLGGAQAEA